MQQLGPVVSRVIHEFERPRVPEMSENQRQLQLEELRFNQPRRLSRPARRRGAQSAWHARAAAQVGAVHRLVAACLTWGRQQPAAGECP